MSQIIEFPIIEAKPSAKNLKYYKICKCGGVMSNGAKMCIECLKEKKHNDKLKKLRCPRCGGLKSSANTKRCEKCYHNNKHYKVGERIRREERKENGKLKKGKRGKNVKTKKKTL